MKKIIYILLLVLLASPAFSQADEKADFSAICPTGQVLYYKIIDYGEVNVCYNLQNPELLGGHIKIPRTVKYNDQNFVVTGIADEAFSNCIRIQGVELPTTMFYIGERAFYRCTDLRIIEMPKTLTSIGASAFEGCTSLIDVVMPNSVTEMGANAFKDCSEMRHIVISHGLTEIPEGAFMNCRSVTDYLIPASVQYFGCHRNPTASPPSAAKYPSTSSSRISPPTRHHISGDSTPSSKCDGIEPKAFAKKTSIPASSY